MTQNNQPLSLEDLPKHLKSVRERGESGNAPVVGMGNIVTPKKRGWTGILLAVVLCLFVGIGGVGVYNAVTPSQLTVTVDADPTVNPQAIASIVSESGGEVIAVKQKDGSSYEVTVSTHSGKGRFLDRLRKRLHIRKTSAED